MTSDRARPLVEGALLAALTVVLSLITAYIPVVQLLSAVAVPAPTVVLTVRRGTRVALLSSVTAGLILLAVTGPVGAVLGWLHVAGIGLPLGLGIRRRWPAGVTLAVTTGSFLVLALVGIAAALLLSGINPVETAIDTYRTAGPAAYAVYDRLGLVPDDPAMRDAFVKSWNAAVDLARTLLPVGLLLGYAGYSLLNYSLNRAVLARLGHHDIPTLPPFARWQAPGWLTYVFAALVGASLLRGELAWQAGSAVLSNLFAGFMIIFSIVGAAAAYAFLRSWRLGRGVAVAVLVLLFLSQFSVVLAWLGMLDGVLRLRQRFIRPDGGEEQAT
ncbi:MAG TPA: YybS family protein [Bacillota bacterium]